MYRLRQLYQRLEAKGLTDDQRRVIERELAMAEQGSDPVRDHLIGPPPVARSLYSYTDPQMLGQGNPSPLMSLVAAQSLDHLLQRDLQREKDGFPRKIRVGKLVKPGRDGDDKVVVIPTTVEEKLIHDRIPEEEEGEGGEGQGQGEGGAGEGEEGEVIGEQPIREQQGGGSGAGQGQGGTHELESTVYDLGRILTEQFALPNLRDKGKKRSLTRFAYDLTDKNRGFGQILDKKATLKRVLQTNIALGRLQAGTPVDVNTLMVSPRDRVYRILSKEKDYESQAVVFFVRDYSGSMAGKPTELVVNQHVLIYAWLSYQYQNQVETRFILHDTEAREVENFQAYYQMQVAGGTQVSSAYRLVNRIVAEEELARDYSIYVFHGTDGDDWDTYGEESLPELEKMLVYASRVGITIAENGLDGTRRTEVEKYLSKSGLLESRKALLRLDVMSKESTETRIIEGIKHLISE
ncbi:protein of unknown function DUF444 [Desulfobulbus propionicus DSM 2032]|uniref:DUF444 family protein n=1 Tax=Desulfobulbus propionicus (strain ATCC 33891 / DSM 2032 / VKM B-1956 / 1pr3) TaxID=577650 RepID=A0A7U3YJD5_DESPD|nr:DUF444 family protein [Desulfobulbus propionicus]ADW16468.1 protein of unknown function DUF444 [Desulfobulbus propionicus DSM 2032]